MINNEERIEVKQIIERALSRIEEALKHMNSAKSWGSFDLWGGGFVSSYFKTSKVKRAEVEIDLLQDELSKLNIYSDDIIDVLDAYESMTTLQQTLDIGLDDIYTNWKSLEQIKRNIEFLEELQESLVDLDNSIKDKF